MTEAPIYSPGGILSLDCARKTGWCYGQIGANRPEYGYFTLPNEGGEGARYNAFEHAIVPMFAAMQPAKLIMASHLPIPAMNNVAAMRQQLSLRAIAIKEAYIASCSVSEFSEPEVRRDILGRRYWPKDGVKHEVLAWCRRHGWDVSTHDVGDACVLWEWHRRQMTGGQMAPGTLWADVAA